VTTPADEVLEQARAMRASLLSMGGNVAVSRAQEMLNWSKRDQREPTLGEVVQALAVLLIVAERKLLEGSYGTE